MTRHRSLLSVSLLTLALGLAYAATQWTLQPKDSTLTFVGTQAGAPFQGAFERFKADIRFDPQDLASSRFEVTIETGSVNTKDSERDDTVKGPDLFATAKWPTARYVAEKFTDKGAGKYSATGQLTLRDVTRSVPIEFTFDNKNGSAWLKGQAILKRLDFGVGQGEWKDTATVGNEVQIRFALLLQQ
ncbi:YceI family protein [Povalibacter sp.]|uniref:YceI family protein n=1 Tax=Povalibacter sp. TaxID=1962978 RepID=UPI002F426E51